MKYLITLNIVLMLGIFIYNVQVEDRTNDMNQERAIEVSKSETNFEDYPDDLATIEVIIQKQYLDGRMDSESIEETITAMEDFWYKYENYQLIDQKVGQMVFRDYIDDISPYLKEVGYFGLADEQLVIFEGEPQYEQNIQIVFELDPDQLTEDERKRLNEGIKIDSKKTYQEVIDVFRHQLPSKQVHGESD
ncbi:intercompartmental signaling factor BofC [Amphibacillus sp. MSJ-3]|uniref:BofC C-terminal domain-containing protein n=1 Tax=Amphibacillus sp. MSJ-3 TaxID=2841505 RepID=UPI001C0F0774|nr:BofC C-terminal domain-containing protein [Amphibacillus sp. MSJ-3]MBU5593580.1 intercompartmental signaling factor BofC [Amphibacillus sp. MSJ-3]